MRTLCDIRPAAPAVFGLILWAWGPQFAVAQQVEAVVNSTTIGTEETLRYTIEVSGADFSGMQAPAPPDAEGLVLLQSTPSTQSSTSWVNGNVTRSVGFQWFYRAEQEGPARILAASVDIDGTTFTTQPIDITVVAQAQRQRPRRRSLLDPFGFDSGAPDPPAVVGERDIFIRAVPNARTVYQNEQVTIDYELFFRTDMQPRNSRLADSWDAEGFWREELDVETRPMPRVSVEKGIRYQSIVLKRVAVFPTRTGTLTVDPLRIETEVFAPQGGSDPFSRSLFSLRTPYVTVERASSQIGVESRPLPPGAPDTFAGAVGDFDLDAQLSRTEVDVGEPVQLTVRLSGAGNIAMLDEPELSLPGIFEAYDPEISTQITTSGSRVSGSKTFTYLLVPRSNGTFDIPPVEFAYFDPTLETYRTLQSGTMTIRATGSAPSIRATTSTVLGFPVDDIAGPLAATRWVRYPAHPLHMRAWPYIVLVVPLILILLTVAARRRVTRHAADTAWSRNRRAHPLARKHLKKAVALQAREDPHAFYEELEKAVKGFVGNRIDIAEVGLTHSQLDNELEAVGLPSTLRKLLQSFLKACDAARFAPTRPTEQAMNDSLDGAHGLIASLDAALRAEGTSR